MILAIDVSYLFKIIHLCCYLFGIIPASFIAFSLDYVKIFKVKTNNAYKIIALGILLTTAYLIGEFLYQLITMFI